VSFSITNLHAAGARLAIEGKLDGAGIGLVLSFARRLHAQGGLLALSGVEAQASIWRELIQLAQA